MIVNGVEFEFDLDARKDYDRFTKALSSLENKKTKSKGRIGLDDMEAFLNGCIPKKALEEILKDGRVSTLTKSFVEFFSAGVDQFAAVSNVYAEAATIANGANERASAIVEKLHAEDNIVNGNGHFHDVDISVPHSKSLNASGGSHIHVLIPPRPPLGGVEGNVGGGEGIASESGTLGGDNLQLINGQ